MLKLMKRLPLFNYLIIPKMLISRLNWVA